jgi:hypothetical protein
MASKPQTFKPFELRLETIEECDDNTDKYFKLLSKMKEEKRIESNREPTLAEMMEMYAELREHFANIDK